MPAVFDKLGIRFTYPENWRVDESEALGGECSVTVYSPGGSFWAVSLHAPETDPRNLVKAAVKALRETYQDLDDEPLTEEIAGHELAGSDVNFYCLDLTNTALVRSFHTPRFNGLVLCQADDREFAEIEPVFRAMTQSLLLGLPNDVGSDDDDSAE
jgi:hypothetical protein